jgi:hypothetical protein
MVTAKATGAKVSKNPTPKSTRHRCTEPVHSVSVFVASVGTIWGTVWGGCRHPCTPPTRAQSDRYRYRWYVGSTGTEVVHPCRTGGTCTGTGGHRWGGTGGHRWTGGRRNRARQRAPIPHRGPILIQCVPVSSLSIFLCGIVFSHA